MDLRLLFVCIGNICRSPMAEGIARAVLANGVRAESAGIAAVTNDRPSAEAVKVMRSVYGMDISRHRARNLADVAASEFDYVIALDAVVFRRIRETGAVPPPRLIGWDIEDPIGLGRGAYEKAARRIESRLIGFAAERGFAG